MTQDGLAAAAAAQPVSRARALARAAHWRLASARDMRRAAGPNTAAWLRDRVRRRSYRLLDEAALRATRRSDTVFLFGSGRSLLDITPGEWQRIAAHDTVSFREFPRQHWVRADYHLTAEVDELDGYARRLRENPLYADSVFVVQEGWLALYGNRLIGRRLLPQSARIFRFRRTGRGVYAPPGRCFADGLVHGFNSSISTTNFAVVMGWKRIVIVGVDLYDKGYFWLEQGETRSYEKPGIEARSRFTGADQIVAVLGRWQELLAPEGIELLVYNPRSLLADVMPVFTWESA